MKINRLVAVRATAHDICTLGEESTKPQHSDMKAAEENKSAEISWRLAAGGWRSPMTNDKE